MSLPSQPRALAELPLAVAEDAVAQRGQQPLVERAQVGVGLLVGPAGEEDRQLHRAALELALVDEPGAGLGQRRHGRGARLRRAGTSLPRAARRGSR